MVAMPRLARRFGVVGRVADRDGVAAFDSELLQNDLEDVRRRFGFLDVVRRRRHVDQVGDARDVEVLVELILLGGGRDGDPDAGIAHASQQIGDRREGTHQRQVFAS